MTRRGTEMRAEELAQLVRCPRCGLVSARVRCERCDAVKLTSCSSACSMCGNSTCVGDEGQDPKGDD